MIKKITLRRSLSYSEILNLQTSEFEKRIECRKNGIPLPEDVVFFVEHRPVYTIGKHGDPSHLLLSKERLESLGTEYVEIGRGGDITYHGPGQLTVYPILDLQRYRLGIKEYVSILEETVIRTIKDYGIAGERIEGRTGVWIDRGRASERKICAIGIKCSRYVSMHGFALNVGPDLHGFAGIIPCGLPQGVTSISLEAAQNKPEFDIPPVDILMNEVENKLFLHLTSLLQLRIPSREIF